MNENRKRIIDGLRKVRAEKLAKIYEGAVRLVEDTEYPGRFRFICHAVREIRNRIPDYFGIPVQERVQYKNLINDIAKDWPVIDTTAFSEAKTIEDAIDTVNVSLTVARKISELIDANDAVSQNNLKRVAQLFEDLEHEKERDRAGLIAVVNKWYKVGGWFEKNAHIPDDPRKDRESEYAQGEIEAKFNAFENGLNSILGDYFSVQEGVEGFIENHRTGIPSKSDVEQLIVSLGKVQCRWYFYRHFANSEWIKPLQEVGVFEQVPEPIDEGEGRISFPGWVQGDYLKRVSGEKPKEVLAIIREIKTENPQVARCCIECLLAMPLDVAIQGDRLIIGFLESRHKTIQFYDWFWVGGPAAKYMNMIAEVDFRKSLAIAHRLLEIRPGGQGQNEVQARFQQNEYLELMRLVKHLWQIQPANTLRVMIQVLDRYLQAINTDDSYIVSGGFKHPIDDLENPTENEIYAEDIEVILIQGICEAGKTVIERQPENMGRMLDYLEKQERPIFWRIALYLMRFVETGRESERLNRFVADAKFANDSTYGNEIRRMIQERWGDIAMEARGRYLQNIADFVAKKTHHFISGNTWDGRKYDEKEARKIAARMAASKLSEFGDLFREALDQYLKAAEVKNEDEVRPRPIRPGEMRWVDPAEGAEFSEDGWLKLDPLKVVEICGDTTKEWTKTDEWVGVLPGEGAQASVLERVVKKRPAEYVQVEAGKVVAMRPAFLAAYFRTIWETIRQGSNELDWNGLTEICSKTVELHHDNTSYRSALNGVCDILKAIMDRDTLREEFISKQIERFWAIVEPLTQYPLGPDETEESDEDKDPIQQGINCVPGQAAQLAIRLGVIQRNRSQETYEQSLRTRMQGLLQWILDRVQVAKVECMIGMWLPQLSFIEEDWMKDHLEDLFDDENPRRWWAIWGTYVIWSRVSPKSFAILKGAGIYGAAVEKIDENPRDHYRESAEEGLMKQLMIAYFNGWMEYDDSLLQRFFEKADANLRGHAAKFLTTGFKSFKEDDKTEAKKRKETIERIRKYWTERLKAGRENPEELIGFTKWAKNALLGDEETLTFLRETLVLTKGKTGDRFGNMRDCLEGICDIGKGHELLAVQCLNLIAEERWVATYYSLVKDVLSGFFRGIVDLPVGTANRTEIWQGAMEFADRLGRMGELDLRWVWETMRATPR